MYAHHVNKRVAICKKVFIKCFCVVTLQQITGLTIYTFLPRMNHAIKGNDFF